MTAEQKNTRDWVDLALLAAIGVLAIGLLLAVPVMRQAPYDTIMYVHFLWRRAWLAIALVVLAMLACLRVWSWRGDTHTSRKKRYLRGLDGLLLLSVGVLPVLLFWPPREAGHDPLRPGAQVCRQYPAPGENRTDAARPPINYLAYLPAEYTASRRWPLVVFLHGSGGRRGKHGGNLLFVRAEGLPNQVERGKQFPFILVSPQSPGAGWRPSLVVELIDYLLRNLPVDPDRVYLTGNSMGGIGTWQVASHYPERFAAIVPLCGGGDVRLARELVNMPIWAFHGAQDDRVPLKVGQAMVDAVNNRGGHAKLTVYPDAGHFINDVTYENEQLYHWLLAQRRSRPQPHSPAAGKDTPRAPLPSSKK